jgi:hypothetical protein
MIVARQKALKYHNKRTTVDGITFSSKKEAGRYIDLKRMEQAGVIRNLKLQPRFRIEHNGVHACDYVADFEYCLDGKIIREDVKGIKTPMYRLKKKLVKAFYNIEIVEI